MGYVPHHEEQQGPSEAAFVVSHKYISVNSDEMEEEKFEGKLVDFAVLKLNQWLASDGKGKRVINIEKSWWTNQVRPVMCNSSTWYDRENIQLSVWLEG